MTADASIVRARIHPGIGIARVGNSEDGFFVGPEVLHPAGWPAPRDTAGALKRQAARFRVYGLDKDDRVVKELTADCAEIRWEVELANTKASWFEFQAPLDIPEAWDPTLPPSLRRNPGVADRASLEIRPGPRAVQAPGDVSRCVGRFRGLDVYLGELRMEASGRLLVLGGRGVSQAPLREPLLGSTNAPGWHDDVGDGPVRARVRLRGGGAIPVEPAWVVVCPPNYAPALRSVRTMNDVLEDLYLRELGQRPPAELSFEQHVQPLLQRQAALQWVNKGFAALFGHAGSEGDASLLAWLQRFDADDAAGLALRQALVGHFRRPGSGVRQPEQWPPLFGDAFLQRSARQSVALTTTQVERLDRWAQGEFGRRRDSPATPDVQWLESLAPADQANMLDRAAMDFCVADAFHPGSELTWPMRHASLYAAPYRIRGIESGPPPAPLAVDRLTPVEALSAGGPLGVQVAGDLTRWMGVPWQADSASCRASGSYRSIYQERFNDYVPAFWPARAPNHVLSYENFLAATNKDLPVDERRQALDHRSEWLRTLGGGSYPQQVEWMVRRFPDMGVIVQADNPDTANGLLPDRLYFEDRRSPGHAFPRPEGPVIHLSPMKAPQEVAPAEDPPRPGDAPR